MAYELAKAYVQIVPSMEGVQSALASGLGGAAAGVGRGAGTAMGGALTAGLGKALKVGGVAALAAVGAAAAGTVSFVKDSVSVGQQFDAAMSQVAATMGTTTDKVADLRDLAIDLGGSTAFSASQAAEGVNILAMAGYEAKDIFSALPGTLDLAAAGGLQIAEAADIATGVLAGFGKSKDEIGGVSDMIAKMASVAKGSVSSFGAGLSAVAGMASTTKQDITDVSAALAVLGNNNYAAAEGGNMLRRVLKNVYLDPKGQKAMKKLGVETYDAAGNARGLNDVMKDLNAALSDKNPQEYAAAMNKIFDSVTIGPAKALLEASAGTFDDLHKKIVDCDGAAKSMAETQLDNLAGSVTIFNSALEAAKIKISDRLSPTLNEFVKFGTTGLTDLTDAFSENGLAGVIGQLPETLKGLKDLLPEDLPQKAKEFFEAIPQAAAEMLSGLADSSPEIIDTVFQSLIGLINGFSVSADSFSESAGKIISAIGNCFENNAQELGTAAGKLLHSLAHALGNNTASSECARSIITGLAEGLVNAVKEMDLTDVMNLMLAPFQFDPIVGTAMSSFSAFGDWWQSSDGPGAKISGAWEGIKQKTTEGVGAIAEGWESMKNAVGEKAEAIHERFTAFTQGAAEKWTSFTDAVSEKWQAAYDIVSPLVDSFRDLFDASWSLIKQTVTDAVNSATQAVKDRWSEVNTALSPVLTAMKESFAGTWADVKEKTTSAINSVKQVFSTGMTAVKTAASSALNGLKQIFTSAFNNIKTTVQNVVNAAKNWGRDLVQNIINGIKQKIQALAGAVGEVAAKIRSLLHFSEPDEGPLADFHTYAPDMMKLFSTGILENIPALGDAARRAAEEMQREFSAPYIAVTSTAPSRYESAQPLSDADGHANAQLSAIVQTLEELLPEIRAGKIIRLDGNAIVGATEKRVDEALGRRSTLQERGV